VYGDSNAKKYEEYILAWRADDNISSTREKSANSIAKTERGRKQQIKHASATRRRRKPSQKEIACASFGTLALRQAATTPQKSIKAAASRAKDRNARHRRWHQTKYRAYKSTRRVKVAFCVGNISVFMRISKRAAWRVAHHGNARAAGHDAHQTSKRLISG